MTAAERRAAIKRLERWFTRARQFERLAIPHPTTREGQRRLDRFQKKYPKGGVIDAVFLYDLFLVATDRGARP